MMDLVSDRKQHNMGKIWKRMSWVLTRLLSSSLFQCMLLGWIFRRHETLFLNRVIFSRRIVGCPGRFDYHGQWLRLLFGKELT